MKHKPALILASASPRRRELLLGMGCQLDVQSADIDESRHSNESADEYVKRVAQEKAQAVALADGHEIDHGRVAVLAADTIVSQGDTVFGKPADKQQAIEMWRQLADSQHQVMTAVSLLFEHEVQTCLVRSSVEFASISEQQMARYWDSGEPQDKAGAYAIQGLASAWVKLIHGSYSNVVGLPLRETNQLLASIGHNWL